MRKLIKFFTGKRDEEKTEKIENYDKEKYEIADFETAISATGFGKFNILLLVLAIPSGWASMFESTTVSYIIPVAHCDLNMSLEDKGYLISITYLGMFSSALVWGFLSDTLGRKKLLVFGFLTTAFFVFLAAISQTFPMILFAKFMSGFIINGPFAVLTAVLSEFHCAKYRARVVLSMGIVFAAANILLPLVGMGLMSKNIEWHIFGTGFVLHSWNIFLLVSGLPSLISGICHIFMLESPKFLMTAGRNEEALEVFRKVYSMNTGKPPDTFPVKKLVEETAQHKESKIEAFKNGFAQMKPLFLAPHLRNIILVCAIQIGSIMGLNTLRLWLPQIFTAISDYQATHNNEDASMCAMLEMVKPNATAVILESAECFVNNEQNSSVYTNSMIVAATSILGYLIIGFLVNALGKKTVLIFLTGTSGISGICIYFTQNSVGAIALSSLFVALAGISTNVVLSIIVDLFPTTLRTMAVAISMMLARAGAMTGNALFPHLISLGCLPPFIFIGLSTIACGLLTTLLPKTDLKPLE